MDRSFIVQLIKENKAFTIETASGRTYHVAGADFINFSPSKTAVGLFWVDEQGHDRHSIIPLLTVTAITDELAYT